MTVMFQDIKYNLVEKGLHNNFFAGQYSGTNFYDLLYADDTMLICKNTRVMNLFIKAIEIESAKYNMSLNKNKCNFIALNFRTPPNVHFQDGTKLTQVNEAVYLGGIMTAKGDAHTEVNARIQKALVTVRSLKTFWNKTNCTKKWKALVYNATVIAQFIYGLENEY